MASGKFQPLPRSLREPVTLALAGVIRDERLRRGWSPDRLKIGRAGAATRPFIGADQQVSPTGSVLICVQLWQKSFLKP